MSGEPPGGQWMYIGPSSLAVLPTGGKPVAAAVLPQGHAKPSSVTCPLGLDAHWDFPA